MDLYAGTPYWLVKNPLWNYFRPLRHDERTKVAVIGAGITGTLVACELQRAGIDCCLVDKRSPATGSSWRQRYHFQPDRRTDTDACRAERDRSPGTCLQSRPPLVADQGFLSRAKRPDWDTSGPVGKKAVRRSILRVCLTRMEYLLHKRVLSFITKFFIT